MRHCTRPARQRSPRWLHHACGSRACSSCSRHVRTTRAAATPTRAELARPCRVPRASRNASGMAFRPARSPRTVAPRGRRRSHVLPTRRSVRPVPADRDAPTNALPVRPCAPAPRSGSVVSTTRIRVSIGRRRRHAAAIRRAPQACAHHRSSARGEARAATTPTRAPSTTRAPLERAPAYRSVHRRTTVPRPARPMARAASPAIPITNRTVHSACRPTRMRRCRSRATRTLP